ncbi:hypothetical protein S40293_00983 [Stachybotrys chartarum IBT 40293]|nr:hypothetical protein S40293_00983 [Stachybotrys chartarum IBT 40293]
MHTPNDNVEPFPSMDPEPTTAPSPPHSISQSTHGRSGAIVNRPAASSSLTGRLRAASKSFEESRVPEGFMAATGDIASSIISIPAAGKPISDSTTTDVSSHTQHPPPSTPDQQAPGWAASKASPQTNTETSIAQEPPGAAPFDNGYHFPPKHAFAESTKLGLIAFWKYVRTPLGFCVTIYGLNVVAWGGMLFLLLCNASPAMCYPDCNDINSPRRVWIEITSQILNALFCVTGFGLIPWRFRDLWFLLQYRLLGKPMALRRLAGINRGWFRLQGSTELPISLGPKNVEASVGAAESTAIPFPLNKIPDAPLTGVRAKPTPTWKLDAAIWLMVMNTFLQAVLAGFMWGMNRYNRPSWATGLFIGLAFGVAGISGYITFLEGKAVKKVEGVPISANDLERLESDREKGIIHYNNIADKNLVEAEEKKKKKKEKRKHRHEDSN